MLISKPTKFGTGIEIFGDYNDFRQLHSFIHRASENDVIPYKFQEFLLGLAYEVRKAYEGQREIKDFGDPVPAFEFETNVLYVGFRYEWISYLISIRLLRWSAAYRPTDLSDQAMLFNLESLTLSALSQYSLKESKEIWEQLNFLDVFSKDYPLQWIEECVREFQSAPNGKKRFGMIPSIMFDLTPFSNKYKSFYHILKQSADAKKCSIDEIRFVNDNNDKINFKW